MADNYFKWLDYLIFGLLLLLSAGIGMYFAFFSKKKQNTRLEYLLGSKTMGVFPISMSLIASYISGISLIGIPSEIYVYGTQYWVVIISEYLVCATIAYVYLPVFYKLQITSSYEYLRLRFDERVRTFGSILFIVKMVHISYGITSIIFLNCDINAQLLYLPLVVYVPALAFSQVTGLNLHLTTAIACVICIFYTTVGGLKAVVWTDTIQMGAMVTGILAVLIIGIKEVGISNIIQRNIDTGRIEFDNFSLDPTQRHTVWGLTIGNYFYWLANCTVNQSVVQRYLAMPNKRKGNLSVLNFAIGITFLVSTCCITGLVVFAYYYDCDPLSLKQIRKADQILPYFVMEVGSAVPGLPGLFVSGVFSAALSSMSSGLNSMTGVIFEDLIRPIVVPVSEARASFLMKVIVVIVGTFCVAMVFIVDKLGALIQAGKSLGGITTGPLLGMFTLGMFFPWANAKGALFGGLAGLTVTSLLSIFSLTAIAFEQITYDKKPLSIGRCPLPTLDPVTLFFSRKEISYASKSQVFWMFKISYLWYTLIGTVTVLVVGMLISYISGFTDPQLLNKDLITPVFHRFLPEIKEKVKIPLQEEEEEM